MHSIDKVSQHILSSKLIPLFYESDVQVVIDVVKALYAGGIRTIEFTNRGPQALDNFKALVALKNEMPDLYLGIGTIKTEEDAKKYIEVALSIAPNNHYILDSMGWLYYRLGKLDSALSFIQKAYEIQPDPEIAAHLGEILWAQGKKKEADDIWQLSLQSFPDNEILKETLKRLH